MNIPKYEQQFGQNLQQQRRKKELTQRELGERIGIGHTSISLWENGERSPSIISLYRLCKTLGCSADELLNLNPRPYTCKERNIEWATIIPPSASLNFTEDIIDGIRLFQYIVANGLVFSQIPAVDPSFANLTSRQLRNKINAALSSGSIVFENVDRDNTREEELKKKYNLLHCFVARLDNLPTDNTVDIPIRSESVAFLAAKYCTPLIRGLEDVGLTGGIPIARFFDLIPPNSQDLVGITWHAFLTTQRLLNIAPMSACANTVVDRLLMRQPHTKGYTMPFINHDRRQPEYYELSKGEDRAELEYSHRVKRMAGYAQAGFLCVGTPAIDYSASETELGNPALIKLFDELSDEDKKNCQGDILLRLLDETGDRIGSEKQQQANDSLVYSIGLNVLHRMVASRQQVWILCDNFLKAKILRAVVLSGLANCLVIENQTADLLLNG